MKSPFDTVIQELVGPLKAEARGAYRDSTIIGRSIAEYARGWAARAQAAGLSEPCCAAVVAALADYRQDATNRPRMVREALRLLEGAAVEGAVPKQKRDAKTASEGRRNAGVPRAAAKKSGGGGDGSPCPTNGNGGRRDAGAPTLLDQPAVLPGRGKEGLLGKLGIETNRELLYHLPREYVPVKRIDELENGERAAVVVRALTREQSSLRQRGNSRLMRFALEVSDDTGRAWITSHANVPKHGPRAMAIMGAPVALNYEPGTELWVEGSVKRAGRFIEITHENSQKVTPGQELVPGTLAPVYPLTEGLYQGQLRGATRKLLAQLPDNLPDPLPVELRKRYDLPPLTQAWREVHWPKNAEVQQVALRRLALEEMLTLQLAMAQRKRELERPGSGISMRPRGDVGVALEEVLPFSLTRAQQRVIAEIVGDMAANYPMHRLLQGDVGSGKTVVAAAALLVALQNGYQGAMMAPTELLSEQHYLVLSHLLDHFGVKVELLTGSLKAAEREQAQRRIADGRAQVVVGTHALIQEGVSFHKLGLVVVDEQHRFGVRQRARLRTKGEQPDLLVMTATPIPRTLAMTAYGDLEMSIVRRDAPRPQAGLDAVGGDGAPGGGARVCPARGRGPGGRPTWCAR